MKNTIFAICAAALVFLAVTGCQKSEKDVFKGNYSFKTSGYFTAACDRQSSGATSEDDTINADLNVISGQMDITDAGDGKLLITMNCIPGGVIALRASVAGNELVLEPAEVKTGFSFGSPLLSESAVLTVSGKGEKYEGILLFDLVYSGSFPIVGKEYRIIESKVICRAKENE